MPAFERGGRDGPKTKPMIHFPKQFQNGGAGGAVAVQTQIMVE
jgi:hypothetical protein